MPESKIPEQKKSQLAKFKETAKQVETENSEEAFDRALKKVAKPSASAPSGERKIQKAP